MKCFPSTLPRKYFEKTATITYHFRFAFEENSISKVSFNFQNVSCLQKQRKISVLKFRLFEEPFLKSFVFVKHY